MSQKPRRVKELQVITAQGAAGDLVRESQFVTRYSADAAYDPARGISLTMPSRATPYTSNRIPPVLAMNLPEGFLLDLVTSRFRKVVDVRDEMNLLALTSTPSSGRVWARNPEAAQNSSDNKPISLQQLLSAKGTEDLFEELVERFALQTSLAGVMPKVAVAEKTHLHTPDLIVKSGAAEFPGLAENEFICMSIARASGIEVPDFWLSEDNKLFVIRRFDLASDGGYVGFEDMASLMGRMPDAKYEGHYGNIALVIKDRVPPAEQAASLQRFYKQLVLCVLLRNGDAHLKNWGLTYGSPATAEADARLSPAYDLVSTTPYIAKDILALGLQGSKAWPDRATLEEFGRQRCDMAQPGSIIDEVCEAAMQFRPRDKTPVWRQVHAQIKAAHATLG